MQKSVTRLSTLVLLAGLTAIASAEGFMPWSKVISMADKDGDGMVSPKEVMFFESDQHFVGFQPFMADHFKDFDLDGDGMVSMEEAKRGRDKLGMTDDELSKAFFEQQGFMPRKAQ